MKKLTSISLALFFVLAAVFSIATDNRERRLSEASIEGAVQAQVKRASEKSKKLAQAAVEKLIEEPVDFTGLLQSNLDGQDERIYCIVCSVAPEAAVLEKRADGALALLELYEEFSDNSACYDWEGLKQRKNRQRTDSNYFWRYEDPDGYKMWETPRIIEGLFAKVFYKKLDKAQQKRFFSALCCIYNTVTVQIEDYLDGTEDACYAYFFFCGGGELLDKYEVCMENGKAVLKSLHTA